MTAAQREKIDANGGAQWVRGLIDAAPDKTAQPWLPVQLDATIKKNADRLARSIIDNPKIQPDPAGLKSREIEGIKSAKAVAKGMTTT